MTTRDPNASCRCSLGCSWRRSVEALITEVVATSACISATAMSLPERRRTSALLVVQPVSRTTEM